MTSFTWEKGSIFGGCKFTHISVEHFSKFGGWELAWFPGEQEHIFDFCNFESSSGGQGRISGGCKLTLLESENTDSITGYPEWLIVDKLIPDFLVKLPDEQTLGDASILSCEFMFGKVSTDDVVGDDSFLAWLVFNVIESASNSYEKIE